MRCDPGEQIVLRARPCWRSMLGFHLRWLIVAVVAGIIAGVASSSGSGRVQTGTVAAAVLAVFALSIGLGAARRRRTTYTLTDRRLVVERGVSRRPAQEAPLSWVYDVGFHQTLRERALAIGSVCVQAGGDAIVLRGVARPRELVLEIHDLLPERDPVAL